MKKFSLLPKKTISRAVWRKGMGGVAAVLSAAMVMGSTLTVDASTIKDVFDASYYSKTYSDLAKAFADNADALYNHYLTYGQKEGRVVVPYIDLKKYKEAYADLRAAFGDNWDAYLQHYLTFGVKEGRKSFGKAFDARAYADRYPDVKKAFGYDVLALYQHYLQFGKNEGRNPLPDAPKAVVSSNSGAPSNPGTPDKPDTPDKPSDPTYPWPWPPVVNPTEKDPTDKNPGDDPSNPDEDKMVSVEGQIVLPDGLDEAPEGSVVVFTEKSTSEASIFVPLSGKVVEVKLNADGSFADKIPAGNYEVTIKLKGYLPISIGAITITAEEDTEGKPSKVEVTLELKSNDEDIPLVKESTEKVTVTGNVKVSGVKVSIYAGWDNTAGEAVTTDTSNAEGNFTLTDLAVGYYTVVFEKEGYKTETKNIAVDEENKECDVELTKDPSDKDPSDKDPSDKDPSPKNPA